MRIPIPVVILIAVAVVGGIWWHGTRHYDFLKAPSDSRLNIIRAQAALSLPAAQQVTDDMTNPGGTVQPIEPLPTSPPAPSTDPDNLPAPEPGVETPQ